VGRSPAQSVLLGESERTLLARAVGVQEAAQALCLPSVNPLLSVWQGWRRNRAFDWVFSQNHRMFGVGRDLCGSSSATPQTPALAVLPLRRQRARTVGVTGTAAGEHSPRALCEPRPARQGRGESHKHGTRAPKENSPAFSEKQF